MMMKVSLIWELMVVCATLCISAPCTIAQDSIRVEPDQILVPAVVFDRKIYTLADKTEEHHRSLSYLVANDSHFRESIAFRNLVAKDFHLYEDGEERPIRGVSVEPPALSIVRDNLGAHPESIGTGGGRWSYPDQLEKNIGLWLPWPQYLIAYVPVASPLGSCHKLQLTVDRPNLVVWAHTEYCNTVHPANDPLNGTEFGKQMEADLASEKQGRINVTLRAVSFARDAATARVYIQLDFPWKSLKHEFKNHTLYANIGTLGMVYNKDGTVAARFSDFACCDYANDGTSSSSSPPSGDRSVQHISPIPDRYETQIELPSGEYDLRVVLSDGEKFGRQQIPLTVGGFTGKQPAISEISFCRRVRKIATGSSDAPIKSAGYYTPLTSGDLVLTPATSAAFRKSEPFYGYFEVYEPRLTEQPPATVALHFRIVDVKTNEQIMDFPAVDAAQYIQPNSSVVPIAREFDPGTLSEGSYRLEIQATDAAGKSTFWRTANFTINSDQSNELANSADDSASLPNGTGIVGVLATELNTKHSKVGERVEVEITEDVKSGDEILVKKGSIVTGQITQVNPFSQGVDSAELEIVFDKVVPKSGEPISTHLAIYALAAKRIDRTDDLQDGSGLIATNTRAGVAGGMLSPPPGLKADSRGLFRIDAMRLLPTAKDNPPTSLVSSQSRDVQLEIGTEIVVVVVGR
jgi:hypothetical protein